MRNIKYLILIISFVFILSGCAKKEEIKEPENIEVEKDEMDQLPVDNNNIDTLKNYNLDKEGNKINNSPKMKEIHNAEGISGLEMNIISKKDNPRYATFTLKLKNTSNKDLSKKDIKIDFKDENNEIKDTVLYQFDKFNIDETIEVTNDEYLRIIDSYDYSIELTEITTVG